MQAGFLDVLRQRGFLQRVTDDETADKPLERLLASKPVTGYVGFDPTASSFHVGNLVAIMGLVHLQRCGHRPIAIVGGGTGMVGDPSGKTEMRRVLDRATIEANVRSLRAQLARYIRLAPEGEGMSGGDPRSTDGLVLDNASWLLSLNYIQFLRDVGRHFSVNRMLAAESVKLRLESESGLSFLEFNYSLLQAYDFLVLHERYGCELQMGGSDQWGNIVAGIDLIRRVRGARAHGVTFPLVTTATGAKMGKTVEGAVWLDASRTSPYAFYQYWINADDRDVGRFLRLFTLLEISEIEELERLEGAEARIAKERLAFEATALTHGKASAEEAREASRALFGAGADAGTGAAVPTHAVSAGDLERGIPAVNLFAECGLCESRNAARRLARQGGLYVHRQPIAEDRVLGPGDLRDGTILLRAGKKKYARIVVREGG